MNSSLILAASDGPHVSIVAETIFHVFGVPVTNSMILGAVAYAVLLGTMLWVARSIHKGSRNRFVLMVQWAYEMLLHATEDIIRDKKLARSVAPLAITMFFAIMLNNWLGVMPGVGSLHSGEAPLLRGMAADLNFTFALAIITMVAVQVYAVKQLGFFGNLGRYFRNPLKDAVGAFEGILELIGEFSRFVALSMRLFGNVFGGEVLLTVMAFLSGWFAWLPLPLFMGFELFIGALQAYVFYMLTIIFISLAVEGHGEQHHASSGKESAAKPVM